MSIGSQLRLVGLSVLSRVDGEALAYLSGTVSCVAIDRNVVVGKDFRDQFLGPDFDVSNLTKIELLKTVVSTKPEPGQTFDDEQGYTHRVQKVTQTDNTWMCWCKTSETAA